MEISEGNIQVRNQPTDLISVYSNKRKNDDLDTDLNEVEIITAAQHFCAIEIKETKNYHVTSEKAIDKDQNEVNESHTSDST